VDKPQCDAAIAEEQHAAGGGQPGRELLDRLHAHTHTRRMTTTPLGMKHGRK
jgi:hypothetical protein